MTKKIVGKDTALDLQRSWVRIPPKKYACDLFHRARESAEYYTVLTHRCEIGKTKINILDPRCKFPSTKNTILIRGGGGGPLVMSA